MADIRNSVFATILKGNFDTFLNTRTIAMTLPQCVFDTLDIQLSGVFICIICVLGVEAHL